MFFNITWLVSNVYFPKLLFLQGSEETPIMDLPYPPACPDKIQQMEEAGCLPQEPIAYAYMSPEGKPLSLVINNPMYADRSMWVDEFGALKLCVDTRYITYNFVPKVHPMAELEEKLPSFSSAADGSTTAASETGCETVLTSATSMANLTDTTSEHSAEELLELIQGDWLSPDGTKYQVTSKKVLVTRVAKAGHAQPHAKSFDLTCEDGAVYWGFKMSYVLSTVNIDDKSCQWSPSDGSNKEPWSWTRATTSEAEAPVSTTEYVSLIFNFLNQTFF